MKNVVRFLFLSCLITSLSAPANAQANVPTPESVLRHSVGEDFYLATYEESLEYFQALAAASNRVELRQIGTTSFGKPWFIALISSAENLVNVERYKEIAQQLARMGTAAGALAVSLGCNRELVGDCSCARDRDL